jgi:hypothetical protein
MEKIMKCGIKKKSGYLYFVDRDGDISAAPMSRKGRSPSKKRDLLKGI